ncbi:Glutathione synthetase [Grifola frondosa]|uniref:Glutathione synthetase n=1 Tax=Grifola frondosa TaxID=5627 RepID=A0A1C7M467_GRIFR|nr:Glutathione synthetase [Grifola frondosa]
MASVHEWPPSLSDAQLQALTLLATTYALSHGLVYLPVAAVQPAVPTAAIHAPLALFPSPFPRPLFQLARRLQSTYNVLYARVALDEQFLDRVMGELEGVGRVDEFTGQLWKKWKLLRDEGIEQTFHLGLFRSDYLLHVPNDDQPISLKQVEFNTISSSFGALSERIAGLHNHPEGLAAAHKAYNTSHAHILFVVQDGERNVFDQRWLEYELLEKHSIHVVRQTFDQLASSASVDLHSRILHITLPSDLHAPLEVSVVYFRAGYTPADYPTPAHYDTRALLERSRAIKCPSIQLQLAGGKKVQEVLTQPGMLEHFLCDAQRWGPRALPQMDADAVRASWMGMWGLDAEGGVERARAQAAGLVLKPQREGGE